MKTYSLLTIIGLLLFINLKAQSDYRSLEIVSEYVSEHIDVKRNTLSCELVTYTRKLSGYQLSNVERLYVPEESKEKKFAKLTKSSLKEINVFPNPSTNYIEIECLHFEGKSAIISVRTNTGQEIINQKISTKEITRLDISGLSKGHYTVTVIQNSKNRASKLIVKE